MINNKKVVAVLPAYNAEKTLQQTVQEIPATVDSCILVDDHSTDATAELAHRLGLTTVATSPCRATTISLNAPSIRSCRR